MTQLQSIRTALVVLAACTSAEPLSAQKPPAGADMYRAWCAQCHGEDGSGRVATPTVKTEPLDFSDCTVATAEPDADWELVIRDGGPAAGLSPEMPAFGEAATAEEITALVGHLRTFCRQTGWPHGNLNFPRPMFTEKAFPENEVIIAPMISHRRGDRARFRTRGVFEKRIGKRTHGEIGVPFETLDWPTGRVVGVGDLTIAAKHVLYASPTTNRILTGGFEVAFPTGSTTWGFGKGSTVLEPYVAAGTLWRDVYVQGQIALEIQTNPVDLDEGRTELVYNTYFGRDLAAVPDTWTIGVEVNGLVNRAERFLAVTPQVRKGLTRTGALAVAGGVRIPINDRQRQFVRWVGYLLWEFLEPVRARR